MKTRRIRQDISVAPQAPPNRVYCYAKKWIKRAVFYFLINGYICLIAVNQSFLISLGRGRSEFAELVAMYVSSVLRMIIPIVFFEGLIAMDVPRIEGDSPREDTTAQFLFRCFLAVFCFNAGFDIILQTQIIPSFGGLREDSGDYLAEFFSFVPKSFVAEMIFDFFHYWTHRYCHQNKFLFSIHSHHHDHVHCGPLSGMDIHPLDFFLTNFVPASITFTVSQILLGGFTEWQWHLFMSYKTAAEIGGHSGLNFNAMSFPQCPLLQWHANSIPLSVSDHEWHHVKPTKNFAKRFAVWDRVFRTYESHRRVHKAVGKAD